MPQSVHALGGFKVQGRATRRAEKVLADAKAIEEAGAYAIVLEAIPPDVAAKVTAAVERPDDRHRRGPRAATGRSSSAPTSSGMSRGHSPKFAKRYAELGDAIVAATRRYVDEVQGGRVPGGRALVQAQPRRGERPASQRTGARRKPPLAAPAPGTSPAPPRRRRQGLTTGSERMNQTETVRGDGAQLVREHVIPGIDDPAVGITFDGRQLVVAAGYRLFRLLPESGRIVDQLETFPIAGGSPSTASSSGSAARTTFRRSRGGRASSSGRSSRSSTPSPGSSASAATSSSSTTVGVRSRASRRSTRPRSIASSPTCRCAASRGPGGSSGRRPRESSFASIRRRRASSAASRCPRASRSSTSRGTRRGASGGSTGERPSCARCRARRRDYACAFVFAGVFAGLGGVGCPRPSTVVMSVAWQERSSRVGRSSRRSTRTRPTSPSSTARSRPSSAPTRPPRARGTRRSTRAASTCCPAGSTRTRTWTCPSAARPRATTSRAARCAAAHGGTTCIVDFAIQTKGEAAPQGPRHVARARPRARPRSTTRST